MLRRIINYSVPLFIFLCLFLAISCTGKKIDEQDSVPELSQSITATKNNPPLGITPSDSGNILQGGDEIGAADIDADSGDNQKVKAIADDAAYRIIME